MGELLITLATEVKECRHRAYACVCTHGKQNPPTLPVERVDPSSVPPFQIAELFQTSEPQGQVYVPLLTALDAPPKSNESVLGVW